MAHFLADTAPQVKASTALSYASSLRAIARRLGTPHTPVLDLLTAGLSVTSTAEPLRQAVPATPRQMRFLAEQAWDTDRTGRLAMALWTAWKTASRWDDVLGLRKTNFIEFDMTRNQVVIEWGTTKTNRRQRFRASAFTGLQEDNQPATLQQLQRVVQRLRADTPLAPLTTAQLRRWMQQFPRTQQLTAHSIKRGALNVLAEQAAQGHFNPRLLALVAKHVDALHDFPSSTLRYVQDKAALARMLGTQDATRFL